MNNHDLSKKENSILYLEGSCTEVHPPLSSVCYSGSAQPLAKLREEEKRIQSVGKITIQVFPEVYNEFVPGWARVW
jgi:hypothetical protein